jgi:hypothetical protein
MAWTKQMGEIADKVQDTLSEALLTTEINFVGCDMDTYVATVAGITRVLASATLAQGGFYTREDQDRAIAMVGEAFDLNLRSMQKVLDEKMRDIGGNA